MSFIRPDERLEFHKLKSNTVNRLYIINSVYCLQLLTDITDVLLQRTLRAVRSVIANLIKD